MQNLYTWTHAPSPQVAIGIAPVASSTATAHAKGASTVTIQSTATVDALSVADTTGPTKTDPLVSNSGSYAGAILVTNTAKEEARPKRPREPIAGSWLCSCENVNYPSRAVCNWRGCNLSQPAAGPTVVVDQAWKIVCDATHAPAGTSRECDTVTASAERSTPSEARPRCRRCWTSCSPA